MQVVVQLVLSKFEVVPSIKQESKEDGANFA